MKGLRHGAFAVCLLVPAANGYGQAASAPGRSSLPATAPTSPAAPLAASPDGAVAHRSQKAQVTFADGLLDVRANNSSLNGILREISRTTGMKLTGGVAEQRVFGNYGPAAPATVLATLLDGTGSNMLLRESTDSAPYELILTPRTGGPSPPSPASYSADEEDSTATPATSTANPALSGADPTVYGRHGAMGAALPAPAGAVGATNGVSGPRSLGQPQNNVNGSPNNVSPTASTYPTTNSVPLDSVPTPSTTPAVSGIVDAPNPAPPGTTTSMGNGTASGQVAGSEGGSSNADGSGAAGPDAAVSGAATGAATGAVSGAATGTLPAGTAADPKTPEQVYQLLQQLRQQSQQQQQDIKQ